MGKNTFVVSLIFIIILIFSSVIYALFFSQTSITEKMALTESTVIIDVGPTLGNYMFYQVFDLIAFLFTLILVLRIGPGRIATPLLFFGFGFLTPTLVPLVFGVKYFWAVPLVQSVFGLLGVLAFMYVFGVFELLLTSSQSE